MRVAENVRLSIDAMEADPPELDLATLLGCAAVDGTARKRYPRLKNRARFVRTVRDSYWVLEALALRGVDLDETRWTNLSLRSPSGDPYDFADVLYEVHRCNHMHGEEVPFGHRFNPTPEVADGLFQYQWTVAKDVLILPDRLPFALVAIAVLAPENSMERKIDGYYFHSDLSTRYLISEWWGRGADFRCIASAEASARVKLDLGDEW